MSQLLALIVRAVRDVQHSSVVLGACLLLIGFRVSAAAYTRLPRGASRRPDARASGCGCLGPLRGAAAGRRGFIPRTYLADAFSLLAAVAAVSGLQLASPFAPASRVRSTVPVLSESDKKEPKGLEVGPLGELPILTLEERGDGWDDVV